MLPQLVIRFLKREKQENKEVCKINSKIACQGFKPLGIDKALSADNIRSRVQREMRQDRERSSRLLSKVVCPHVLWTDKINTNESKAPAAATDIQ